MAGEMVPMCLETVQFHEDNLQAIRLPDGKVYVSLRRCCECLGIDFSSQRKRLKDKGRSPWATVVKMTTVAEDGAERELTMIDLDTLPMWLATITPAQVSDCVRPKLERFQKECARVLRDYFFGKPATDPILGLLESTKLLRLQQIEHERRLTHAEQLAAKANATAQAALAQSKANYGYYSVLGWARLHGRELTIEQASRHGKELTKMCRQAGIFTGQMNDPRFGVVNTYPESVLRSYFGDTDEPIPDVP